MDMRTAEILADVTADFYRRQAGSFSATRRAPWRGWQRLLAGPAGEALAPMPGPPAPAAAGLGRVLDVACGNLRFERFLAEAAPDARLRVDAVDGCPALAGDAPAGTAFRELDVTAALLADDLERKLPRGPYRLVACFGFLHHVPGARNRAELLRVLAGRLAPGGCLAASFWQFGNSPELMDRARAAHARALPALAARGLRPDALEPGDYLLGWQGAPDAFRYCHRFDRAQVDALLAAAGLAGRVVDRFEADGRTGDLNAYVVVRGASAPSSKPHSRTSGSKRTPERA